VLSIPFLVPGKFNSRAGRTLQFGEAELAQIASYNPAQRRAPLLVSHDLPDGETEDTVLNRKELAFGLVDKVQRVGKTLVAKVSKHSPKVAEWIKNGQLPGVSMKVWHPQDPDNPTPGKYSLRHLALLGATDPAVPGLPEPSFGEFELGTTDPAYDLEFSLFTIGAPMTDSTDQELEFSAREADLQRRELEFAARQEATVLVGGLVSGGQLPPAWGEPVIALRTRLAALQGDTNLEFSLGGEQIAEPPIETLDRLLKGLSKGIEFSKDVSGEDGGPDPKASLTLKDAEAKARALYERREQQ
jgi:hypothetical protein